MDIQTIIIGVLSGGIGAGVVTGIFTLLANRQKHKYERQDTETADVKALKTAMRYLMLDRIRHLGEKYLTAGEIDFDDRRLLNEMHDSYHNGLGGNGDLDILMQEVNRLPLKK